MMKTILATGLAAVLAGIGPTTSINAAVTLCVSPGCVQPDSNVLFDSDMTGNTIVGSLNDLPDVDVNFTGDESLSALANGQARVSGSDGNLTFLSFGLDGTQTFSEVEFNLNALEDGFATLTFLGTGGTILFVSDPLAINAAGQNFFGGFGEPFTGIQISSTSPLEDVRQVRLGGFATTTPVPEPATWAMMLLGLGAIGFSMRSRRRRETALQIA